MKIDGIDPLLLNRIKEQTDRMEIQRAENASTDTRVSRDGGYRRAGVPTIPDLKYGKKVEAALRRLNENAEKDGFPLRFSVRKEPNLWHVEVRDLASNSVVRDIPTTEALDVVNRIYSLFGVLLDEKR